MKAVSFDDYVDDDLDFVCMSVDGGDGAGECLALSEGGGAMRRITLDSASDDHVLPASMVPEGAKQRLDSGPVLRDAQRDVIPLDGVATIPMTIGGGAR